MEVVKLGKKIVLKLVLFSLNVVTCTAYAELFIVGSSTVYPFSVKVAESYSIRNKSSSPRVESIGTGGGMRLFCSKETQPQPDIVNASRVVQPKERKICKDNNRNLVEFTIGHDGIVIAINNKKWNDNFRLADLHKAIAKYVLNQEGVFIPNPHRYWNEINPNWPKIRIEIYGPPHSSGTRDVIEELILAQVCEKEYKRTKEKKHGNLLSKKAHARYCLSIRSDGYYIDSGENDNLIVNKLRNNKFALGIIGYGSYFQQRRIIHALKIDQVIPSNRTIAEQKYPLARKLFFYAEKNNLKVNDALRSYIQEFFSVRSMGKQGYLSRLGLISIEDKQRRATLARLKRLSK